MQFVSIIFAWAVLSLISAMRFEQQTQFSDEERSRLAQLHDRVALSEQQHVEQLPLLRSLQTSIVALCSAAFVGFCTIQLGFAAGISIAAAGLVLVPLAYRVSVVRSIADKLTLMLTPFYIRGITTLRPLLVWLRDRDRLSERVRLNSSEELLGLLRTSPGVLSTDEMRRLEASLQFDAAIVSDVMTPRSMINGIEANEGLGPLVLDDLYKTGHSRFPVYKKDLDHMVGMLYLHDIIDLKQGEKSVEHAMHKRVYYIHEGQPLSEALAGFLRTRHHLFVVVNDYRETVGLLSLEDTIEKLLGTKIADEFDAFDDLRAVAERNPKKNNLPVKRHDV
jgi:CBS domain containing-hemolysin-like protein